MKIIYSNTKLELSDDANAIDVETLEKMKKVLNTIIDLTKKGYFDEQINALAEAWAAKRIGKRGPRKPKSPESTEQAA